MDFIMGNTGLMMEKSLDYLWEKQRVTLNNLANNDTPGFKAQYVTFEEELKGRLSALRKTKPSQMKEIIQNSNIRIRNTDDISVRLDGNNVNVDSENVELARSGLQYQYVVKAFNDDYTRLRSVIRGQ